ncbi:MAG: hypothetical protein CVU39_28145 [Chloroflexi bacterium HGW-Chloroflexi-10]|nr:MAG: hypothetical protein CVU39_28145 [Chloroflexi bacterium HGW-Chloroflexi-10]
MKHLISQRANLFFFMGAAASVVLFSIGLLCQTGGNWRAWLWFVSGTGLGVTFLFILAAQKYKKRMAQINEYERELTQLRYLYEQSQRDYDIEHRFFNILIDNVADSIYIKDRSCRMIRINRKMMQDLGLPSMEEAIGKTDKDMFGEEFGRQTMAVDLEIMESGRPVIGQIESRNLPDGHTNWTSTSKVAIHNDAGEIIGLIGITREINDLKQAELNLRFLATHDNLTQLPNRTLLNDRLERAIFHNHRAAILFIDLDGFKRINDEHGHNNGDRVLMKVADRLKTCVRTSDSTARIGGDEFIVFLETITLSEDAAIVAQKLLDTFGDPLELGEFQVVVNLSIGISIFPENGGSTETLIQRADAAMYLAKTRGKNQFAFYSELRNELSEE